MTRTSTLALFSLLFATTVFADSADLDVVASVPNPLMVSMAVVNRGPDVARDSFLTIDFPPDLVLDRVVSVYGPCDYAQRPVRCSLGDIPLFAPPSTFAYYMAAYFKGPLVDATYAVRFTVSSDTPDPNSYDFRLWAHSCGFGLSSRTEHGQPDPRGDPRRSAALRTAFLELKLAPNTPS